VNKSKVLSSSFRDPSGFVFTVDGQFYRQVNQAYREDYDRLMTSGLYDVLTRDDLLLKHTEVNPTIALDPQAYKILQPVQLPFISYPYEWSFDQLHDAALLTLRIQQIALDYGMTLKDASAYNVQFLGCHPLFIDTLSFEQYKEGEPWVAYRQFCQHFLAPLALMAYCDVRLSHLLRIYIDGIPLDLASRLLPWTTRVRLPLLMHIHLHSMAQRRYADSVAGGATLARGRKFNRLSQLGLLDSLESGLSKLRWRENDTAWADYYANTNYSTTALGAKANKVSVFLEMAKPQLVCDLGANTARFSRLASQQGAFVVAADVDPGAVNLAYREGKNNEETSLLPLVLDLTNPSPALGWANEERESFAERGDFDLVLALALVHHLAIANNVPLEQVATYFAGLAPQLIVEFVPKSDSQVQRLLASRADIFPKYTQAGFEQAFARTYNILRQEAIPDSKRMLYLMRRKETTDAT
jgi:SAM-dependent methyltransferase